MGNKKIKYRLENVEKVTCDLTEKIDRIETVLNKMNFSEKKDFITISESPETVQNIDIVTNKVVDDKPEIIGDYMHYRSEDYYRMDGCCNNCDLLKNRNCDIDISDCDGNRCWKNIKEIDITDNIAKLRPWVKCDFYKTHISKLYGVSNNIAIMLDYKIIENKYFFFNEIIANISQYKIATVSYLKKAGITE